MYVCLWVVDMDMSRFENDMFMYACEFETSGNLPIILEESIVEYTPNE